MRAAGKPANTVEANLAVWDREHDWPEDGDEWNGQAVKCGKSYKSWKHSLLQTLVVPHATGSSVLEIGCGHGRWSASLIDLASHAWLVDLSPNCVEFCKHRFANRENVDYYVTEGSSLPPDIDETIDFVWSFDSFVHMDEPVIDAYLREIDRVLRPGGRAVIHHAGRRHSTLWLGGLLRAGSPGRLLYRAVSMGVDETNDGWRSNISRELFSSLATQAGLALKRQTDMWGDGFGVPRYNDTISILRKPHPASSI